MSCRSCSSIQKSVVYHLIFFFILTPFLASCGGGSGDVTVPPHDTLTLSVPEIVGTDGVIIYRGQVYTDTVEVPSNALMTAVKGDDVYLYHPALGTAELSEETSQLAIGYFIIMGQNSNSATSSATRQSNARIPWDEDYMLDTKISMYLSHEEELEPDNPDVVSSTALESLYIENNLRRWVAIKSHPNQSGMVLFIPPRQGPLDTFSNIYATGQAFFEGLGFSFSFVDMLGGNAENLSLPSDGVYRFDEPSHDTIETYGSMVRCVPLYFINSMYPNSISSETLDHIKETSQEAFLKDPDTFMRVNLLDMVQMISDGVETLMNSTMPSACQQLLYKKLFLRVHRTELIGALTGDTNIRNVYWCKDLQDLGHDVSLCIGEGTIVAGAAVPAAAPYTTYVSQVSNAISQFTDGVAAFRFLFDDNLIAMATIKDSVAYDYAELPQDNLPLGSSEYVGHWHVLQENTTSLLWYADTLMMDNGRFNLQLYFTGATLGSVQRGNWTYSSRYNTLTLIGDDNSEIISGPIHWETENDFWQTGTWAGMSEQKRFAWLKQEDPDDDECPCDGPTCPTRCPD
jgi:hypothetical protein